jgi:glycosyltransferase involved in cell wall biosynthesis
MHKLVIFNEHISAYLFEDIILGEIKKIVPDCLVWSEENQKDLTYLIKNKDNRIYSKVLDYCTENKIEHLHFLYLTSPEIFLAELNYRYRYGKTFDTKITFATDWRLVEISESRQMIMDQIIHHPYISKMMVFSTIGKESSYLGSYNPDSFHLSKKIEKFYIPKLVDVKPFPMKEAREFYNLPLDKFILLYFGAMNYGKGLDLLLEAMKKVNENVLLFIACGEGRINFPTPPELLSEHSTRIIWRKENPADEELSRIYGTADFVALPYRSTYKNCGSSVLVQASQAYKNVIMPRITPFKEVVEENNLGILFEADNVDSLAQAINKSYIYYSQLKEEANFENHLSKIQSWAEYVEVMLK